MKKHGPLVIFVLVTAAVVVSAQTPQTRPVEAQVTPPSPMSSPSPASGPVDHREATRQIQALPPAERQEAMRRMRERRQAERQRPADPAKPALARPDNNTQVQVVSVDTTAGTMTFVDVEGETNTWKFEPAGIAAEPLLKPGARVTIIWKSDKTGLPIPTILGVAAFAKPSPPPSRDRRAFELGPAGRRQQGPPGRMQGPLRQGPPTTSPKPAVPGASASPTPAASPSQH